MMRPDYTLYISGLKTDNFAFLHISFFEHVESNQSNTRDHKKPSQQEQPFFPQSSFLFLRASVFSLLNKESMI